MSSSIISVFSVNSKTNKRYDCVLIGDYCINKGPYDIPIFKDNVEIIQYDNIEDRMNVSYNSFNAPYSTDNFRPIHIQLPIKRYDNDSTCSCVTYFHLEIQDNITSERFILPFYAVNGTVRIEIEDSESLRIISENNSIADTIFTHVKREKFQLADRRILKYIENPLSFINMITPDELHILEEVHKDSEAIKNAYKIFYDNAGLNLHCAQ